MLLTCIPMTDYFAKYTVADAYFYQTGQNKIKFVFVYCHLQIYRVGIIFEFLFSLLE